MDNKTTQTGMDFPHDLPRQGKKFVQQNTTQPKQTKKDRKRIAAYLRGLKEQAT